MPFTYDYPRPQVTVDLVVFARGPDGALRVLLIERKQDPFAGRWAIPGGFMEIDEPVADAARRELREETGLEAGSLPLWTLGTYADPGRDPRGRTISIASVTLAPELSLVQGGDDARAARWFDVKSPPALAFDHDQILADARAWLARLGEGPELLGFFGETIRPREVRAFFGHLRGHGRGVDAWLRRLVAAGRLVAADDLPGAFRKVEAIEAP